MPLKILVCNHPAKSSEEGQSHYVAGFFWQIKTIRKNNLNFWLYKRYSLGTRRDRAPFPRSTGNVGLPVAAAGLLSSDTIKEGGTTEKLLWTIFDESINHYHTCALVKKVSTNLSKCKIWIIYLFNRPLLSCLKLLFQSEAKCEAIDMKIISHSHANKTHFHKGLALRLVLKLRGFGTRKGPMKWPIQLPVCPAE